MNRIDVDVAAAPVLPTIAENWTDGCTGEWPMPQTPRIELQSAGDVKPDETTIVRLATLSLLEYERVRKDEAKKLGCRESILDSLVKAKRILLRPLNETDNLQGEIVNLTDVEPWPEPVNGVEILDAISQRFEHYVVLPQGAADTLTLWCAHTHLFKVFQVSPRVHISSPTHECGKTTLRDCTSLFCARAVPTDNMTTAVMHPGTIRKRIANLDADKSGKYDSATALELIFCGAAPGENGFVSLPEATRLLTIEKQKQIALQNEIIRGERIPISDTIEVVGQVFTSLRGIVKASLPVERANEVFAEMRQACEWLQQKADEVTPNANSESRNS